MGLFDAFRAKKHQKQQEQYEIEEKARRTKGQDICGRGYELINDDKDEEAFACFLNAAEQGNSDAKYMAALCYGDGIGTTKNEQRAVEILFELADKENDSRAQYQLGCFYLYGTGVKKDIQKAIFWLKKAADEGYGDALRNNDNREKAAYSLGYIYRDGKGVEINGNEAIYYFVKASSDKDKIGAIATLEIARMYHFGKVIKRDDQKALKWSENFVNKYDFNKRIHDDDYEKYANVVRRQIKIMGFIGDCYMDGVGTQKNEYNAVQWYEKAAKSGDVESMFKLGEHYYGKNTVRAEQYFTEAYRNGYDKAAARLGKIKYGLAINAFNNNNIDEAEQLFKAAIKFGNEYAKEGLNKTLNIKEQRYEQEKEYFKGLIDKFNNGDNSVIINIALCYYCGSGVKKDRAKALYYACEKAKEYCSSDDRVYIPECKDETMEYEFREAYDVECAGRDYYLAARMYENLAQKGHVEAMKRLGDLYCGIMYDESHEGGQKWNGEAKAHNHPMKCGSLKSIIELAKDQNAEAVSYLFRHFYFGLPSPLNKELGEVFGLLAIELTEELAGRGNAKAMYDLHYLYSGFKSSKVKDAEEKSIYWARCAVSKQHGRMLADVAANYTDFGYSRNNGLDFAKEAHRTGVTYAYMVIDLIEKGVY